MEQLECWQEKEKTEKDILKEHFGVKDYKKRVN